MQLAPPCVVNFWYHCPCFLSTDTLFFMLSCTECTRGQWAACVVPGGNSKCGLIPQQTRIFRSNTTELHSDFVLCTVQVVSHTAAEHMWKELVTLMDGGVQPVTCSSSSNSSMWHLLCFITPLQKIKKYLPKATAGNISVSLSTWHKSELNCLNDTMQVLSYLMS